MVGVELENQGGEGSAGAHWEARIMLGDYMISTDYPEIIISDISLALFEDSGWYEVNYYTGGLFRFGKGQGCKFLNSVCLSSSKSNFEWDFCDIKEKSKCTSNNLNRGICYINNYNSSLPAFYQYFDNPRTGGWGPVDYCPVTMIYPSNTYYFSGSCINGELDEIESSYPSSLGFSISENSICIESSLIDSSDNSLLIYGYERAMCHKINCNSKDKTITVDIGKTTIDCPTDGGYMEVDGYNGTIRCPPYNRVCTSKTYVGDSINAALKHITSQDNSNSYSKSYSNSYSFTIKVNFILILLNFFLILFI